VFRRTDVIDWVAAQKQFLFDRTVSAAVYRLITQRVGTYDTAPPGVQAVCNITDLSFNAPPPVALSFTPLQQKSAIGIIYPRVGAITDQATAVHTEGTYSVQRSSSNNTNTEAHRAFDYNSNTLWQSATAYNSGSGVYNGQNSTLVDGVTTSGEWIEITLPVSIKAELINISTGFDDILLQNRAPRTFTVAAFVDGAWTKC
jgi:hypothetical protein